MKKGTCIAVAAGTSKRCQSPEAHPRLPELCRAHGRILEEGRELDSARGRIRLDDLEKGAPGSPRSPDRETGRPVAPGESPPPEPRRPGSAPPAPPFPPLEVDPLPPPARERPPAAAAQLELDEGPEAEPAARAATAPDANLDALDRLAADIWADPASRVAELEAEAAHLDGGLRESFGSGAAAAAAPPASSASALAGRWDKERTAAVLRLAELRFEADGKDALSAKELDTWAEAMAPVFDELFGRLDPSNKYVAATLATGAVILPRYGGELWEWARQLGARRRGLRPASSAPAGAAAPDTPPDIGGGSWFDRTRAAS